MLASQMMIMLVMLSVVTVNAQPVALPGCPSKCGDINIPYPFGIGDDCARHRGFTITCNTSFTPPKPSLAVLNNSELDLLEIQLPLGLLRINQLIAYNCHHWLGDNSTSQYAWSDLSHLPYKFSDSRNKFVGIGCDTVAYLEGKNGSFYSGCTSICTDIAYVTNGTCSGIGCCEIPIPKGQEDFIVYATSIYNHSYCRDFSPCSYAFLVDDGWFNFTSAMFEGFRTLTNVPVSLDWTVSNQTCEQARKNSSGYACVAEQSVCVDSTNGPGYRCVCSQGYQGNPYLQNGCADVDECSERNSPCVRECRNTRGGFSCHCPRGMRGDGRKDGSGCTSAVAFVDIILGSGLSLLFVTVIGSWLYWAFRRRKLMKLKEKFFGKNGGYLLQQQMSSLQGTTHSMKLFTVEELQSATNNFDENGILGRGGSGTVYKGKLQSSEQAVAIKKSRICDATQIEQFINEVIVLSHINHRNVVKLMGCCLETEVPLLVYEFVSNGTLYHHIQNRGSLSWETRLRVASECAGALAYLHSAASIPIIHRDVKSTNILLDQNYTAKVSDFGTSRLVLFEKGCLTSLVRGTIGYLDPEYFHTAEFTDKSDVYSFGVLLVELLTGEKPIVSVEKSQEKRNLTAHFISSIKDNTLFQIVEERVLEEGSPEQLSAVANLARRCLRLKGKERPRMKEVAIELEGLRFDGHPWSSNVEEDQGHANLLQQGKLILNDDDDDYDYSDEFEISGSIEQDKVFSMS